MFAGQDNMLELSCLSGYLLQYLFERKNLFFEISQQMITNVFDKATSLFFREKCIYFYFSPKTSSTRMRVDNWFLCKFWVINCKKIKSMWIFKIIQYQHTFNKHGHSVLATSSQWRHSAVVRYHLKEYVYIHI